MDICSLKEAGCFLTDEDIYGGVVAWSALLLKLCSQPLSIGWCEVVYEGLSWGSWAYSTQGAGVID
jgi:hypothetical protein